MTTENRPDQHAYTDPSPELAEEISPGTRFRQLVDDLFTCEAVAEKLHDVPEDDERFPSLVDTWKQALTLHLEEAAAISIENFLTAVEHAKTNPDQLFPATFVKDPNLDQSGPSAQS